MIDVTVGQYYPGNSPIHRLDPRVKIIATIAFIVSVFFIRNLDSFLLATAFFTGCIVVSRVPFGLMLRSLRAILFILIFTFVITIFATPGTVLVQLGALRITKEGISTGVYMLLRLAYLVIGASIMTLTTTPNALTNGMEYVMRPLKVFHVPVHELAMVMSIALRFIPILQGEMDRIMKAQKARGADFESGGPVQRVRSLVPLLVPLFVSAIRRADELATAMEARCYHGGEGRTKMHPLVYQRRDAAAYILLAVYMTAMIILAYRPVTGIRFLR